MSPIGAALRSEAVPAAAAAPEASLPPPRARIVLFGEPLLRYTPRDDSGRVGRGASACGSKSVLNLEETEWKCSVIGAELNLAVALRRLGWPTPFFVSALPETQQGEEAVRLLQEALGGPEAAAGGLLLRRAPGRVGTVRTVGPVNVYDRDSVFSRLHKAWFCEPFWAAFLSLVALQGTPRPSAAFLQLSGSTPLLSQETARAWNHSLRGAAHARARGAPLAVVIELAPCQDVSGCLELWMAIRPHIRILDMLVVSIGVLAPLCRLLAKPGASAKHLPKAGNCALEAALADDTILLQKLPEELRNVAAVDRVLSNLLLLLHGALQGPQLPMLLLAVKVRDKGRSPSQWRWSLACDGTRVLSTVEAALHHQPRSREGGADAWLAGALDALASSAPAPPEAAKPSQPYRLAAEQSRWLAALRRGDRLAALKQDGCTLSSDFCTITREELNGAACLSEPRGGLEEDEEEEDATEEQGEDSGFSPKRRRCGEILRSPLL